MGRHVLLCIICIGVKGTREADSTFLHFSETVVGATGIRHSADVRRNVASIVVEGVSVKANRGI